MKQQKGFNLVGLVVVITVVGIVGLVGYYVWQKTRPIEAKETAASATPATQAATVTAAESKVPEGYVLYESTNPKFSFAYPKEWDAHTEANNKYGVVVNVHPLSAQIDRGYGSGQVIKYDASSKEVIYYSKMSDVQPQIKPDVLWKDSTKTIYDLTVGEGGGWQLQFGFIVGDKLVIATAPAFSGGEKTTYITNPSTVTDETPLDVIVPTISY